MRAICWSVLLAGAAIGHRVPVVARDQRVALDDGDRIVLVGGTTIERMQAHSHFETLLTRAFPHKNLVFRNLGWSGDTVYGEARAVFGDAEDGYRRLVGDLKLTRPTLVLVGYGNNEAHAGAAGVTRFRQGLERLLDDVIAIGARPVILLPAYYRALEPPLPDPRPYNRDLDRYREVLAQVAEARGLTTIDLEPADETARWPTDNGMHPTPFGHWLLGRRLAEQLGMPDDEWSVTIDASSGEHEARGTELSEVSAGRRSVAFRAVDRRLPDPQRGGYGRLRIDGLAPGQYALSVDGERRTLAEADQWRAGVAIAVAGSAEVDRLRSAIDTKNTLFFHRYRPQNETYLFLFRKHEQGNNAAEIPQFDPLIEEQERWIARLRQPQPHRYEIRKVEHERQDNHP